MAGYKSFQRKLWVAFWLTVSSGAVLLTGLIFWPLDESTNDEVVAAPEPKVTIGKERVIVSLEDFGESLNKRLQRPLEDPPPAAPRPAVVTAQPVSAPLPDIQLIGTADDSDPTRSVAWLQLSGSPVILAGLGQKMNKIPGEPLVERIGAGTATLRFGERKLILQVKKPKAKP